MTQENAYAQCAEILLGLPRYTPMEANGTTYILVAVADRDNDIALQAHIINPATPASCDKETFKKLSTDQQVALAALEGISEALHKAHQNVQRMMQHEELKDMLPPGLMERLKSLYTATKEED